MTTNEEIKTLCWMIRHYQTLANSVWETYPEITDAYLVYDHYMLHVQYYQDRLDAIFDE